MIKLLSKIKHKEQDYEIGAVVNLPPLIENRMIENGYATLAENETTEAESKPKKRGTKK